MAKILTKPFVQWAGGKRRIIDELTKRLPVRFDRYFEPFLGGGALFWELQPKTAFISDLNPELINAYNAVKYIPNHVIKKLKEHKKLHSEEYYYKVRDWDCSFSDDKAGRFIYLNKTCYNALYRVNSQGRFNVPMNTNLKNPSILDEQNLLNCSRVLHSVSVRCQPYNCGFPETPTNEDFVYLDPPYYGTFDGYTPDRFDEEAHEELFKYLCLLDAKGVKWMLSNSDRPQVRLLYARFNIETISALKTISRQADQRKEYDELIIRNYK